jgi:hypothetical protein
MNSTGLRRQLLVCFNSPALNARFIPVKTTSDKELTKQQIQETAKNPLTWILIAVRDGLYLDRPNIDALSACRHS